MTLHGFHVFWAPVSSHTISNDYNTSLSYISYVFRTEIAQEVPKTWLEGGHVRLSNSLVICHGR
jgi:hypothetical protein